MKSIIALLLGLSTAFADKAFSWDSSDTDATRSYDGVVIQVYKADGESPVVTLGTSEDDHESTFCLNFVRTFEAEGYDMTATSTSSSDYTEVEGSSVDLGAANCSVSEVGDSSFVIACNDINGGDLTLNFTFIEGDDSSTGNNGIEYSITLEGYEWVSTDSTAQFVLVQSVEDCSTEYEYDSEDDDEETDDDEADTEDTETDTEARRRMEEDTETETDTETEDEDTGDDTDSADEEAGISSDDSNEYDNGFSQFVLTGQAVDQCDGTSTDIESNLAENSDADELHIVFAHFDCTLYMDPEWVVDSSKINAAGSVSVLVAAVVGFVASLF